MFKKVLFGLSLISLPLAADLNLMQNEIKHIVFIMLENRSLDNTLAWLYEQGETPLHVIPENSNPYYNGLAEQDLSGLANELKSSSGKLIFSSPPIKGVPSVAGTPLVNSPYNDPNETFDHVTKQIFGFEGATNPNMKGFLQDFASLWEEDDWLKAEHDIKGIMETYTKAELPVLYSLAKHYAVSDAWFSSVPTQTNPNRAFSMCGTSEGEINNGTFGKNTFKSETIFNRLYQFTPEKKWGIFIQGDMVPLIFPGALTTQLFPQVKNIPDFEKCLHPFDRFHEMARNGQLPYFSFIEPLWTFSLNLSPEEIDFFHVKDTLIGILGNDMHPPGDVRTAENLLANIYTSLIANPEAWNQTLLIISFDEHGGIYDHVSPPSAIAPDNHFEKGFAFDRFGVRVPTLFISPRIAKSTVIRSDTDIPFDHTSLLSTMLTAIGADPSQWKMGDRAANAPTFVNVLTLENPREDSAIHPSETVITSQNVVNMGDSFYLVDRMGRYIASSEFLWKCALYGDYKDRVSLKFMPGSGPLTHGSFAMIQSNAPHLGSENFLEALALLDCEYAENKHLPKQWWTIKSVDNPYLGYPIHYGDKIYLENHIYLDPFVYTPSRLAARNDLFGGFLTTKPVKDEGCNQEYWTILPLEN